MSDILNEKDFWNEISKKYPKAFNHFMEWIDKYKEENNWVKLFNIEVMHHTLGNDEEGNLVGVYEPVDLKTFRPKYHELPIAMQFGIFLEYLKKYSSIQSVGINNPLKTISYHLAKIQLRILK